MNTPSKFPLMPLPDVVFFQEGPGLRKWQWTTSGMKVINVTNILFDGSVDTSNTDRYISLEEFQKKYSYFAVEDCDVVVASSGNTYGKVGRINQTHLPLMMNTSVIRFHSGNREKLDDDYLFAFLRSNLFLDQVEQYVIGSAQPNFGPIHLKRMLIPIPNIDIQRRVADILSFYDDLIENNTRRIRILEQMSQTIYQEWFGKVDKDSLPKGWKTVTVGDVCNVGRGSSPRPITDQIYFEGGTIPWIKIADATKSGKYLYETKEHVNEYGASFSRLLPKGSLILAASGTLGFPQLLGVDGCVHDGWLYINEFNGATRDYLYYVFKSKQVFFSNSAYGAAIQNINTTILREMEILLPPIELQNKFSNYVSGIDKLLQNIEKSNANLRQTRDLLLPRLVSGEIDVSSLL